MPELVKNPDFSRTSRRGSKYDFAEYADGHAYRFYSGSDYTSKPQSFVTQARQWAKANGYDPQTKIEYDDPADESEEVKDSSVLVRFLELVDEDDAPQPGDPNTDDASDDDDE